MDEKRKAELRLSNCYHPPTMALVIAELLDDNDAKDKEVERPQAGKLSKPEIVCLCGSTRFYEAFQEANYRLTLEGKIILSVGFYMHTPQTVHGQSLGCTSAQKIQMDELHKRKIDLCDRVLVLNVGGYIGESTRSEIEYAKAHGKPVEYLEPTAGGHDNG